MIHHASRHPERPGSSPKSDIPRAGHRLAAVCTALVLTSCASGGGATPADSATATDADWRALAQPRPEPLAGAPRLAFSGVELGSPAPWTAAAPLPIDLGISELVVTGLLRRRDVQLVERRRFTAAAEAEREGRPRPPSAPPVGVSPGAELTARAVWLPIGAEQAALEVRLADAATGAVGAARRTSVPVDTDMVGVARAIVAGILAALDDVDRLPVWDDPVPNTAPATYRTSGIPDEAVQRFLLGLAAEEQWNWEGARRSYEAAAMPGFVEAQAALARTARLRSGGTLGES